MLDFGGLLELSLLSPEAALSWSLPVLTVTERLENKTGWQVYLMSG